MANFPFQRLQSDLAALIGSASPGSRLVSEPKLAKQLGVSRATLSEAMRTFETQGLIRRRQGAGTFVVGKVPVIDAGLEVLESLDTMARRMNLVITVSDLNLEQVDADENLAIELNVPVGTCLTRVARVMRADTRPVAYLIDVLSEDVLKLQDLPQGFNGSVLDFLLERIEFLARNAGRFVAWTRPSGEPIVAADSLAELEAATAAAGYARGDYVCEFAHPVPTPVAPEM